MPLPAPTRRTFLAMVPATALTACAATPPPLSVAADGQLAPQAYVISRDEARRVPFRALDAVNALRAEAGLQPLVLDSSLTAAAATHARDMSLQNRPWLFGSDGSSPIDRARRAGYRGRLLGETISESYETELETIVAWAREPDERRILLDREARAMGFAFHQEPNGKLWWVLNVGGGAGVGAPLA